MKVFLQPLLTLNPCAFMSSGINTSQLGLHPSERSCARVCVIWVVCFMCMDMMSMSQRNMTQWKSDLNSKFSILSYKVLTFKPLKYSHPSKTLIYYIKDTNL